MSHKNDVVEQIRKRKKLEKMSKDITIKLQNMTAAERVDFLQDLYDKLEVINAELKDIEEKSAKLPLTTKHYQPRDISVDKQYLVMFIAAICGGFTGGLLTAALPEVTLLASIAGATTGSAVGCVSVELLRERTLPRLMNGLILKLYSARKEKLLEDKNQMDNKIKHAEKVKMDLLLGK